jgi:hypothetical protein
VGIHRFGHSPYGERVEGIGWRDITGQISTRGIGTDPTWSQMGSGPFYAHKFAIGKEAWVNLHIPHDMVPGTQFHVHAHWVTSGTNTAVVKWQFDVAVAKGFNQSAFDMAGSAVTAEEAASGTAWKHMVTESTGISSAEYEVDGLILINITRVTNGGTDNTDDVFLLMSDIHYQSNDTATRNKAPNFYI